MNRLCNVCRCQQYGARYNSDGVLVRAYTAPLFYFPTVVKVKIPPVWINEQALYLKQTPGFEEWCRKQLSEIYSRMDQEILGDKI